TATVLVMRGQHDQVGSLLASALAAVGADEYRSVAARARHAAGIAALAEGNYLTAYAQLSQLFGADGMPLHQHVPYLAIADLAAAAPARWWRALDPGRGSGTASLRRDHASPARRTGRARRAHRAAARDRHLRRTRPDQQRDRRPPVPVSPHRRLAPVPLLPQARHSRPPPAPRPHRPRRHRPAVGSATPEAVAFLAPTR